jgi:hypothetical protein
LKTRFIIVVASAVLVLAGCATPSTPSGSTSGTPSSQLGALATGQCLGNLDAGATPSLTEVDCSEAHYWEVAAILPATGDAYPGEAALRQIAEAGCGTAFSDYVGVDPGQSPFGVTFIAPNQTHWTDPGNRRVACLVGSGAGGLVGSLAGTALSFPSKGQCTGQPVADSYAIDLISCAKAHYYEVYATKKWSGKAAPTTAEFDKLYKTVCVAGFKSFVGLDVGKSKYEISYSMVPADQWKKLKDHRLVCSAGSPTGKITGSLKGAKE